MYTSIKLVDFTLLLPCLRAALSYLAHPQLRITLRLMKSYENSMSVIRRRGLLEALRVFYPLAILVTQAQSLTLHAKRQFLPHNIDTPFSNWQPNSDSTNRHFKPQVEYTYPIGNQNQLESLWVGKLLRHLLGQPWIDDYTKRGFPTLATKPNDYFET